MFESITFSTQDKNNVLKPLNMGSLIECLLFYNKVFIIADKAVLAQLIGYFGLDRLIILIDEGFIKIQYLESLVGIHSSVRGNVECHNIVEISSPQHTFQDELRRICTAISGHTGKGRRYANRLQNKISVCRHDKMILDGAMHTILDQQYIKDAATIILSEWLPELSSKVEFEFATERSNDGIIVKSNLNYTTINAIYHRRVSPKHSSITPAYILVQILGVEKELYFAADHLSELATCNLSSLLANKKLDYIMAKSDKSKKELMQFMEYEFHNGKAIREAVNAGRVDLDELIKVLRHSIRFKQWLNNISPDEKIMNAYYQEVTKSTFVDKLPGKSIRWTVFTALGLLADGLGSGGLGTGAGVALVSCNRNNRNKM